MPLPHFPGGPYNQIEPVYKNLYEVYINSESITDIENNKFTESLISLEKNKMKFTVNDDFKINESLLKLKKFKMIVKIHDREGSIMSVLEYYDCEIIDLGYSFLNYDYGSNDLVDYEVEFKYESFKFYNQNNVEQYQRKEKLERLINN